MQPQRPTDIANYLKTLFLKGQGTVTQEPGAASPSTRKFYSYHPGYDIAVNQGTAITPSSKTKVLGSYMDNSGYGLRSLVQDESTGYKYYLSHLSKALPTGEYNPGATIGYTGGVPGAWGAGNTTGAHLDITPADANILSVPQQGNYYGSLMQNVKRTFNPQDIIAKARSMYPGIVAIASDPNKLSDIAKQRGGQVVKIRV